MDFITFRQRYQSISKLDLTDGPARNIFEPKFNARREMEELVKELQNLFAQESNVNCLCEIVECFAFIGRNMIETEESKDGSVYLFKAYSLLHSVMEKKVIDNIFNVDTLTCSQILQDCDQLPLCVSDYSCVCLPLMRTLNALGMYLSAEQLADAIKVLHWAEKIYNDWQKWFSEQMHTCSLEQLPINAEGELNLTYKTTNSIAENCSVNDRSSFIDTNKAHEITILSNQLELFEIEKEFTLTLFFLAQSYSAMKEIELGSFYCQRTLVQQFRCRQQFDKTKWCDNALQLSQFYISRNEYERALHCIQAAESMSKSILCTDSTNLLDKELEVQKQQQGMNKIHNIVDKQEVTTEQTGDNSEDMSNAKRELLEENDTASSLRLSNVSICTNTKQNKNNNTNKIVKSNDLGSDDHDDDSSNYSDESRGRIAWAYGSLYLHFLQHCIEELRVKKSKSMESSEFEQNCAILEVDDSNWVDLPGATPLSYQKKFRNVEQFEQARVEFQLANRYFTRALRYYPFESCCTDHIQLVESVCALYAALSEYESNRNRIIAMLMRRINMLESFPFKLSFKAYPTNVRQLLYDIGCLYTELINLRSAQRRECTTDERPLSNCAFNSLIDKAEFYYTSFISTWIKPECWELFEETDKQVKLTIAEDNVKIIEEEARLAYFNALVNLSQCLSQYVYDDLHAEYDGLQKCINICKHGLRFAKINSFDCNRKTHIDKEVVLLTELMNMLEMKQKNVYLTAQRTGLLRNETLTQITSIE